MTGVKREIRTQEALRFGWEATRKNFWVFTLLLLLEGLVTLVPEAMGWITGNDHARLVFSLLLIIPSLLLTVLYSRIALKACFNEAGTLEDLSIAFRLIPSYLGSSLIYALLVLLGTILLLIPGAYWLVRYYLATWVIVHKGVGPIASLRASAEITRGAWWPLFWFVNLILLINLAGFLALLIGLFVTVPMSMVATAHVYLQLTGQLPGGQPKPLTPNGSAGVGNTV